MSATITSTIPASTIVNVVPSVIGAGGSALELLGLMLSKSTRTPIGSVLSFPIGSGSDPAAPVGNYYGFTSPEYKNASIYFKGTLKSTTLPAALLISQYPLAAVGAYLRGGNISTLPLASLQALSGTIIVTVDGVAHTSSAINLSSATSFSSASELITNGLGLTGPTQATATGTFGATFTGNASGTALTITSCVGTIHPGSLASAAIVGTGIPSSTYIVNQTSGTPGGNGVYVTSASTTASAASVVCSSNYVDVSAVATGVLAIGQEVTGSGITAGTYITALGTGNGGTGSYITTTAQEVASESLTLVMPTCTYDSISGAFTIISATTGASSTMSFATGTLASSLLLTQATGAVTSQGAIAAVPSTFMAGIVAQTTNWASFWTDFDPDSGSGNAQKQLFAAWVNSTNNRYAYIVDDMDITPTESTAATTSLGYILDLIDSSGTVPIYEPSVMYLAAFIAGFIASINFSATNGRATAAFQGQSGLGISVNNATAAANLEANGYNFTGDFATADQQFQWFYPGSITGPYQWIDSYVNQIWLNNALQLALMELLNNTNSIPYNPAGYGLIRAALLDPIQAAVNFGAIRQNVPLSNAQAAEVNTAAGLTISGVLQTQGWYLQILAATPQVRAARGTPPMSFWYVDGESVQRLQLASILIQ